MKALGKDITKQEMQHLREEGWSNYEIAEKLGCCYATVLKYLGTQPKGVRGDRLYTVPKKVEYVVEEKEAQEAAMNVQEMTVKGKSVSIKANFENEKVTFLNSYGEITIPMQYLDSLLDDVQTAKNMGEKFGGNADGPNCQA